LVPVDLLARAVDSIKEGVILYDVEGRIHYANPAVEELYGYTPDELIGKSIHIFEPIDRKPLAADIVRRAMSSAWRGEVVARRKDATQVRVQLTASPVHSSDGKRVGVVTVAHDVTDRRKAEEALLHQTDLYESLLKAQSDLGEGVAILDSEGRFLYANDALCEMFEYSRDELLAMASFVQLVAPDLVDFVGNRFAQRLRGAEVPEHYDLAGLTQSGKRLELEVADKRLQTGSGTQIIVLVRDITERKRIEAQLFQSEKLRSLGVMAAGVAHHMNNVLAGVLGQADLLLETAEDPAVRQRLQTIIQSAQEGAAAVHRVKQFAYEAPAETSEHVDLTTLLRDVVAATEPRWKGEANLEGRTIDVSIATPEPVWTVGVPSELREAVVNVVLNAVDALPLGGKISVEVSVRGKRAVLRIADNGTGMSDEVLGRVYDPFFTTKPLGQGTGLGLAITYGIVQRHGGTVEVTSESGSGTTVEILLPAAPAAEVPEQSGERDGPTRPLRILVVDDEPVLAEQLYAILALDSHRVRVCTGGAEAIVALREEQFDLVITDLGMPGINGWSVASEAKGRTPPVRVGLVTGWANASDDDGPDPSRDCVDFVIAKPYRVQMVRDAIASAAGS